MNPPPESSQVPARFDRLYKHPHGDAQIALRGIDLEGYPAINAPKTLGSPDVARRAQQAFALTPLKARRSLRIADKITLVLLKSGNDDCGYPPHEKILPTVLPMGSCKCHSYGVVYRMCDIATYPPSNRTTVRASRP